MMENLSEADKKRSMTQISNTLILGKFAPKKPTMDLLSSCISYFLNLKLKLN